MHSAKLGEDHMKSGRINTFVVVLMLAVAACIVWGESASAQTISWTRRQTTGLCLTELVYAHDVFLAMDCNGKVMRSADGISWTTHNTGAANWMMGLAASSTGFVIVGKNGVIRTSLDGTSWSDAVSGAPNDFEDVACGGATCLAGYWTSGGGVGVLSTNGGTTWAPSDPGCSPTALAYSSSGGWYCLESAYSYTAVANSIALNKWTSVGLPGLTSMENIKDVGGVILIFGPNDTIALLGSGSSYTLAYQKSSGATLTDAASGAGLFVAVGGGRTLVSSDSGATWVPQNTALGFGVNAIAYGSGRFVVVTQYGEIYTSDGGGGGGGSVVDNARDYLSIIKAEIPTAKKAPKGKVKSAVNAARKAISQALNGLASLLASSEAEVKSGLPKCTRKNLKSLKRAFNAGKKKNKAKSKAGWNTCKRLVNKMLK